MFLDTGDPAVTIRRWAVRVASHFHLAEALRVVDDGASLVALHLDKADVQVGEVDGGAGGVKGWQKVDSQ